jgi:homocysteine S-methyltransferase
LYLTGGGLETTLIFHMGIEVPHFASFALMRTADGRALIRDCCRPYIEAARDNGVGFILDGPTWRASADWGAKLGYTKEELAAANRDAVQMTLELREEYETAATPIVVSATLGPRGDGYAPGELMTADEAAAYHAEQIAVLADTDADMLTAFTLTNIPEAIGIARAAKTAGMPIALSFTLETDGKLPTGDALGEAIAAVDAATERYPVYYMINCAHPKHFTPALEAGGPWLDRLLGVRANASTRSHAELNGATDLDAGDPIELGAQYRRLVERFANIRIVGGCCGTDARHIASIGRECRHVAA